MEGESDSGARGDHRGRGWGDILSDGSYSRTGPRGCDGGRVGVHGGVLELTIARIWFHCVLSSISCTNHSLVVPSWCVFPESLIGEMEGKEREREEN